MVLKPRATLRSSSPEHRPSSKAVSAHVSTQPGRQPWLETLCSDAIKNELDPSNTSSAFFYAMVVLQPVVIGLLACMLPIVLLVNQPGDVSVTFWTWNEYHTVALGCFGPHWVGYLYSEATGSDKWFDVTEDIGLMALFIYKYRAMAHRTWAHNLVWATAILWCARLLCFLGWRIVVKGSDWRFDKLVSSRAYNLFGWTCGGTWCFLNGACLWLLSGSETDAHAHTPEVRGMGKEGLHEASGLSPTQQGLVCGGVALALVGLTVETIADLQKSAFNGGRDSRKSQKTWIQSGLWRYSRHPNYCGEITVWTGLAIASASILSSARGNFTHAAVSLAFVSPAWSVFFLFFTSLMLLEKRADARYAHAKGYGQYKRNVPVLWPVHI